MKCHYEILGISRDAEDDEIKKSYRKLALKHHPDKNPDNIEECTKIFHQIQQAYEVLIDPQERAWYDKHREAILKGGLGKGDEYQDNSLDVYQYFNTACFSGYGDDEKGFYAVFSEVFHTIATEDLEFMDDEDEDDSDLDFPEFGNSQSSYEEVVGPFYAFWESYSTAKSYVWVEKYDTREAPNRQIRRLMEQDNKKLRDKAKKERNEEVRALVSFVRKRDRRVQAYKKLLEERAAEIAKRAEERKQKDREKRLKVMENYKETGWSAMSGLENDLAQLEAKYAQQYGDVDDIQSDEEEGDGEWEDEEEDFLDDLFCVACNKEFKSDKAYANHEKSKKHRENVAFLRRQMEADEEAMVEVGQDGIVRSAVFEAAGDDADQLDDFVDDSTPKTKLTKKQKKKKKQQQKKFAASEANEAESDILADKMKDLKVVGSENDQTDTSPKCETNVAQSDPKLLGNVSEDSSQKDVTVDNPDSSQVNEKEAISDSPPDHTNKNRKHNVKEKMTDKTYENTTQSVPQICNRCGSSFKTRNKLFQHIKETGHALRVDTDSRGTEGVAAGGGKGRKNKKTKR